MVWMHTCIMMLLQFKATPLSWQRGTFAPLHPPSGTLKHKNTAGSGPPPFMDATIYDSQTETLYNATP